MNLQETGDKAAMGLSLLCVMHCILTPILLVSLPALTGSAILESEVIHLTLLFAVVPVSLFSLWIGYRSHQRLKIVTIGIIGLVVLVAAALLEHEISSKLLAAIATSIGAGLVAYSHFLNLRQRCPVEPLQG